MAFLFPVLPTGKYNFTFISNHKDLRPSGGGAVQRISQMGDRFKFEHTMALNGAQGMGIVASLNANAGQRVRIPVPQLLDIGTPGEAVQASGANGGTTLKVKGVLPSYRFQSGQFITVVRSGKRYLHQIATETTATVGGTATLAIVPMLRTSITGNEVIEVSNPTIEGYLATRENPWVQNIGVTVTITVEEAE